MNKKIQYPQKLSPLFNQFDKYRYFVPYGGRGSGKSWTVAIRYFLLMETDQSENGEGVHFLCLRKNKTDLEKSAYILIKNIIHMFGASKRYRILKSTATIINKQNKNYITFMGMQDYNADNVKSIEDVKYCWFEEAEGLSEKVYDLLIPTIRKSGSKLFFVFNPQKKYDFIYKKFVTNPIKDSRVCSIEINYLDNPFCPQETIDEAEQCKKEDFEKYQWIWLGQPKATDTEQFISEELIDNAVNRYFDLKPFQYKHLPVVLGVDPAWEGSDHFVIMKRQGQHSEILESIQTTTNMIEMARLIADYAEKFDTNNVFIDEGYGQGIISYARDKGIRGWKSFSFHGEVEHRIDGSHERYHRRKEQMWGGLKDWLQFENGCIPDNADLIEELLSIHILIDTKSVIRFEKKSETRKRLNKSRSYDYGDGLALTFAIAENRLKTGFTPYWGVKNPNMKWTEMTA